MRAHEATGFDQWLMANFLAVPILMVSAILLVLTISLVIFVLQDRKVLDSPQVSFNIALVLVTDVIAGFWAVHAIKTVPLAQLLTPGNLAWIILPTILAAMISYSAGWLRLQCKHTKGE